MDDKLLPAAARDARGYIVMTPRALMWLTMSAYTFALTVVLAVMEKDSVLRLAEAAAGLGVAVAMVSEGCRVLDALYVPTGGEFA